MIRLPGDGIETPGIRRFVNAFLFTAILACGSTIEAKTIHAVLKADSPLIQYGLSRLETALLAHDHRLQFETGASATHPDLIVEIGGVDDLNTLGAEGFHLARVNRENGSTLQLTGADERGAMYGLLDLTDEVRFGAGIGDITEKTVKARVSFRAIKFNLPWMSYRTGESLQLHMETCRDLEFWKSFLDMMAENRFNALTLWNLHPFTFMIRPKDFPLACPFSDEELADWRRFWRSLFAMAKERGIETYIVNWNIFTSPEFAEHYGAADYSKDWSFFGSGDTSKQVEQYTRECVTQVIDEYEDLTGLGVTLGERMGGMTAAQRRDWLDRTFISGMKAAGRKVKFIHRAPLSANTGSGGSTSKSTEQITREAIEKMDVDEPIWVSFKYNWSHGHSSPDLQIVHGGELTDTYWNPAPQNYKIVWTIRNEDFFVLRWGQPEFIRNLIANNGQNYVGGLIIGSECYIPAKDYIHQHNSHQTWTYAFERQWLFYSLWGRLLYDPSTPDSFFARQLESRFSISSGPELLDAWGLASKTPLRLASLYQGTWDATLYSEGFLRDAPNGSAGFIDIDRLIDRPVLDPAYVSIHDYVESGGYVDRGHISPIQLADSLERDCMKAMELVAQIRASETVTPTLDCELLDIDTWSQLGLYLANKIRGGVALATLRNTGGESEKQSAIDALTRAADHWRSVIQLVESHDNAVIPYVFDERFSWRKYLPDVLNDIKIAQDSRHGG
ncbi:MAG: hypothetical protein GC154_16205 [bacterium]|nr:hypothetical protein [bacterium]